MPTDNSVRLVDGSHMRTVLQDFNRLVGANFSSEESALLVVAARLDELVDLLDRRLSALQELTGTQR